jgi:hypothetical protein
MSSKIETEIKNIKGLISTVKKTGYQQEDLENLKKILEDFKKKDLKDLNDLNDLKQMLQEIHCLENGTGERNKIVSEIKGVKNEIIRIFGLKKEDSKKDCSESNSKKQVSKKFRLHNKLDNSFSESYSKQDKNTHTSNNIIEEIKYLIKGINNQALFKLEKENLTPQGQNIDEILSKVENIDEKLFPEVLEDLKELQKQLQNYGTDFEFKFDQNLNDLSSLKESIEDLETIPAKIQDTQKKIDEVLEKINSLSTPETNETPTNIPKEEKAVIDLAKYMKDGIAQFENIAKEYVSKISDLENLENLKSKHIEELNKARQEGFEQGKKEGEINFIKNLVENSPSLAENLTSEYLSNKFQKDEIIDVTNENKNELGIYLDGEIETAKYKILTPAILLDNKVLVRAKVEKLSEEKLSESEKDG